MIYLKHKLRDWLFKGELANAQSKGFEVGCETAKKDIENEVNKKFTEKMSDYYNKNWLINPKQVFTISPSGIPYIGFEPITKDKAKQLQSEAKLLKDFTLWEVFQQTIKQEAIKKSVYESTEFSHVLPGKMMIHNLGLLQAIVKSILNIDIDKVPEASGQNSAIK